MLDPINLPFSKYLPSKLVLVPSSAKVSHAYFSTANISSIIG